MQNSKKTKPAETTADLSTINIGLGLDLSPADSRYRRMKDIALSNRLIFIHHRLTGLHPLIPSFNEGLDFPKKPISRHIMDDGSEVRF